MNTLFEFGFRLVVLSLLLSAATLLFFVAMYVISEIWLFLQRHNVPLFKKSPAPKDYFDRW